MMILPISVVWNHRNVKEYYIVLIKLYYESGLVKMSHHYRGYGYIQESDYKNTP